MKHFWTRFYDRNTISLFLIFSLKLNYIVQFFMNHLKSPTKREKSGSVHVIGLKFRRRWSGDTHHTWGRKILNSPLNISQWIEYVAMDLFGCGSNVMICKSPVWCWHHRLVLPILQLFKSSKFLPTAIKKYSHIKIYTESDHFILDLQCLTRPKNLRE